MENISWDKIINSAPDVIKEILNGLKNNKENPEYHPEGNTYDHIKTVTERLIKTGDMDLVMAGLFHDIGKSSVSQKSEDGNYNTSHGHENVSSQLVLRYKEWIREMGANPYVVNEIVKNHMKVKFDGISKKDKDRLERYTIFQKLTQFADADNMKRKWDLDEGLNLRKKKGSVKFGNVTVNWELLSEKEVGTFYYNHLKPIRLTYVVDDIGEVKNVSDPLWKSYIDETNKKFNEIRKYFEDRGYYLWSY